MFAFRVEGSTIVFAFEKLRPEVVVADVVFVFELVVTMNHAEIIVIGTRTSFIAIDVAGTVVEAVRERPGASRNALAIAVAVDDAFEVHILAGVFTFNRSSVIPTVRIDMSVMTAVTCSGENREK